MKAFNNSLSLLALLLSFAAPFSVNADGAKDDYTAEKSYTPSSAISSIYQELRENPDKYDLEKAGQSLGDAIREYGEERAYPLLGEAILEQDHLIQVRSYFVILMETENGRVVAEETALTLLSDGSAGVPKQLSALEVIGDLGNLNNAPIVQTYLNNEDESIRLKAAEILDGWKVDSSVGIPPILRIQEVVKTVEEVEPPEPAIEEPAKITPVEVAEETPEQSSQWWLWLVGALVVVGGLGLVLRRKS